MLSQVMPINMPCNVCTFDAINEAMALVNALVGVVDEVEMIDEEDEDNNGDNN